MIALACVLTVGGFGLIAVALKEAVSEYVTAYVRNRLMVRRLADLNQTSC